MKYLACFLIYTHFNFWLNQFWIVIYIQVPWASRFESDQSDEETGWLGHSCCHRYAVCVNAGKIDSLSPAWTRQCSRGSGPTCTWKIYPLQTLLLETSVQLTKTALWSLILPPPPHKTYGHRSCQFAAPHLWNNLPLHIKQEKRLNSCLFYFFFSRCTMTTTWDKNNSTNHLSFPPRSSWKVF